LSPPPADPLPALTQIPVHPGDLLTIETPGGGAWGKRTTNDSNES
jgi:N-methylhydantoinase B/oxoprolinase/acetone carboxylase alpha subunit